MCISRENIFCLLLQISVTPGSISIFIVHDIIKYTMDKFLKKSRNIKMK